MTLKENSTKSPLFLLYFFILYIGNCASISASNSVFMATLSLPLFKANPVFIGVFVATSRYALIILTLITFIYADKINKKYFIMWGSVFGLLAFLGLSFSSGYLTLFAFALFYGFAYMVGLNYMIILLLDYTPVASRTTVLGLYSTSSSIGTFIGPYFARLILNHVIDGAGPNPHFPEMSFFGFINPFSSIPNPNLIFLSGFIEYAILSIALILAFRINKKLPSFAKAEVSLHPDQQLKPQNKKRGLFKELFEDYSGVTSLNILLGSMWITTMTFVPSFDHVIGLGESSWFFFSFSTVALLGRFFLTPQLKRWKVRFYISTSYYIYICCFFLILAFGFFPSWWILALTGGLQGLAHGVLYPSMNILFTHKVPNQTAKSTLAFIVMFHVGTLSNIIFSGLFAIASHYLGERDGYYLGFLIISLLYSTLVYYSLNKRGLKTFFHDVDLINKRAS